MRQAKNGEMKWPWEDTPKRKSKFRCLKYLLLCDTVEKKTHVLNFDKIKAPFKAKDENDCHSRLKITH